jgi:HlyD family type I secretion membrane fusion protein
VLLAAPALWASYQIGKHGKGTAAELVSWLPLEPITALRDSLLARAQVLPSNETVEWLLAAPSDALESWRWLGDVVQAIPVWLLVCLTGLLLLVLASLYRQRRRRGVTELPREYSGARALAVNDEGHAAMPPSDSARGAVFAGWITLLLFFGGFGTWAATAPLNGAVVGEAVVKVEGNRKSVQHLEGGIVREIRVREGDLVEAGDVLVVLDDSRTRAEHDVLSQQYAVLRATEARLYAEFSRSPHIDFPPDLLVRTEPYVDAAMEGQRQEFESRRQAIGGQELMLKQRAAQLQEQIVGHKARLEAQQKQLTSVRDETESLADLLKKGLVTKPRILQLDRAAASLEGEIASTAAAIASGREALGELSEQITQLQKEQSMKVTAALHDVQSRLLDVEPRLRNADNALERNAIRSPYSGKIVDQSFFSVNGVIQPGERILDIVPHATSLVVEARVRVEDISEVRPGMPAEIHFTSYKQRITPTINGTVVEVSADRLTDERQGFAYYNAMVAVDTGELAASPEIQLYPGMPATVMITTQERTALDYLLGPLTASFNGAFRQR